MSADPPALPVTGLLRYGLQAQSYKLNFKYAIADSKLIRTEKRVIVLALRLRRIEKTVWSPLAATADGGHKIYTINWGKIT